MTEEEFFQAVMYTMIGRELEFKPPNPKRSMVKLLHVIEQVQKEPDTSDIPEANEDWFKKAKLIPPRSKK
jgi:hypothetical protein